MISRVKGIVREPAIFGPALVLCAIDRGKPSSWALECEDTKTTVSSPVVVPSREGRKVAEAEPVGAIRIFARVSATFN